MQMWISWTLGLQSTAQTSTNKQESRMIQAYQFFNEPVANSFVFLLFPSLHLFPTCELPNIQRYHTNDSTLSNSEAREAKKKRDAPCSTSVIKSEGGAGAKKNSDFFCECNFCKAHAAEN